MDEECQRLLKKIEEARDRQDALTYFNSCNELRDIIEIPIKDKILYAAGKADADYLSERKKEERDLGDIAREGEPSENKQREVERSGFWKELYDSVEIDLVQKRNVTGRITCNVNGFVSIKGGWVAHLIYDFLGKKYKDIFVDYDHNVDLKEALDSGLEKITYNFQPYLVRKTGSKEKIYYIKIGNFSKQDQPTPLDIFSKGMHQAVKVWQKRKLLVRCRPKVYGEERKTDLSKKPAWVIEKIFRNWRRKVENRKN